VLLALQPQTASFSYDSRGNRLATISSSAATTPLASDQANRLTGYGSSVTYAYNGDGLRASKTSSGTTTQYTWDTSGSTPLLLVDGATDYVYGLGGLPLEQVNHSAITYYYQDQLGSTRALATSKGSVAATYTYDTYGNLSGSTGSVTNPFGFAGQYQDPETGLIYLRARYYDPATGQFLSRDPLVDLTHAAYQYVDGNPLNDTDPLGLSKCGQWSLGGLIDCGARVGHWVEHHPGDVATGLAIGACVATGTFGVCAAGAVAAFGFRVAQRHLFECGTLSQDLTDGALTYLTIGLVASPASLAEAASIDEVGNASGEVLTGRQAYFVRAAAGSAVDIAGWVGGLIAGASR
jgi:RHS repeat-associated protein